MIMLHTTEVLIPIFLHSTLFFGYFAIGRLFIICFILIHPPYWPIRFVHFFMCIIYFYAYITYNFFIVNCYIVITRDVLLTVANFLVSIIVLIRMYKKNQIRN